MAQAEGQRQRVTREQQTGHGMGAGPAAFLSKRKTPEFSIQSRPLRARHSFQTGHVQRWLRYSGMLTPQKIPIVVAASACVAGGSEAPGDLAAGRVQRGRVDQEGHQSGAYGVTP